MKMMLGAFATIAFAGAAFAQAAPAIQDRAKDAYTGCLIRAAQSADDQKASPTVVAGKILKTCLSDFDRVVDSYTNGATPQVKAKVRRTAMTEPGYLANAVAIVREARARRAKPGLK